MLMGEFEHALDSKGRLFVPAKMRENLGPSFVVTKGVDGCLDVYPLEAWEKLKNSFAQKMMPKQKMRDVSRFIFGGACEVEPDKQGRILLPANLRTYAREHMGECCLVFREEYSNIIERFGLVQRKCPDNQRVYKDVLIRRKGYRLSKLDKKFVTELCESKRKYL